jgi:hypothetical protein
MRKKITNAWVNGNYKFLSVYGVKDAYAWELVLMKQILLSKQNLKSIGIKKVSFNEMINVSPKIISKLLERCGWKWIKLDVDLYNY